MKKMILILVLVVGLFGSDSEEIGIPYIEKGKGTIQSAVLDPDGKHFYTLKGEIVTKWQLEPIEKIYSFKTGLISKEQFMKLPSNCNKMKDAYHISIDSSSQKMIIRNRNEITIWNLNNKKLIKRIQQKTLWGTIDGSNYVTISRKNNNVNYIKWDVSSMKKLKIVSIPDFCKTSNDCSFGISHHYSINSKILTLFASSLVSILDKKTLNPIRHINKNNKKSCFSDINQSYIYCYDEDYDINMINTNNLKVTRIKKDKFSYSGSKYFYKNVYKVYSSNKFLSLACNTKLGCKYLSPYIFYNIKSNKKIADFYLFDNGGWILKKGRYFQISSDAKQYLKMRIKSKKIVPINNKTYIKYNKKIKLKG